jgi:hypothetical protein
MRPLALLLCVLLLPACGSLYNLGQKARAKSREKELKKLTEASASEASSRLGEKAAGEVMSVDADGGYALIRARQGLVLETGQELESRGKGTARLRVTPERNSKMFFFAADIVSGIPQIGDPVTPVKGGGKPAPKLVPVVNRSLTGSSAPDHTLHVDPSAIRPENLPRTTLDDPLPPPEDATPAAPAPGGDPGNLLEPPLPSLPRLPDQ